MNIDDVLLTGKEIEAIWADLDKKMLIETNYLWDKAIAKAAQLKLLEWLKEGCEEHNHFGSEYWLKGKPNPHIECSECMSELESNLKEGR